MMVYRNHENYHIMFIKLIEMSIKLMICIKSVAAISCLYYIRMALFHLPELVMNVLMLSFADFESI